MTRLKFANTGISLLCVDDDPVTRKVLDSILMQKFPGIKLHFAENGGTGLKLYLEQMPQIVITDISMPVMDGIQMAREIKASESETIVIAVSAYSNTQYLINAIEIGINHYVIKPIDHQKLISLIEKCIAGIELEWQVREQEREIRRLSSFPQLNPNPVLELDMDGKVLFCNKAAEKIEVQAGGEYRSNLFAQGLPELLKEMLENGDGQHEREIDINGEIYFEQIHLVPQFNSLRIYATNITGRKQAEEDLLESEKRYRELSITDSLTKLFNSRHFYDQLRDEIERADRYGHPLSLLLLDIDYFKGYNDSYGHLEGDNVLKVLAEVIGHNLRQSDTAYRYGGEEFTVILPETGSANALLVAERIRAGFEKKELSPQPDLRVHMTISIGVGQHIPDEPLSAFIKRVDKGMYKAKELGENQISYASSTSGAHKWNEKILNNKL
jgi:two-component system cell cycle response regulator